MSGARDEIFASLRTATPPNDPTRSGPRAERAKRFDWPEMPSSSVDIFRARVEQAGGTFESAEGADWTAGSDWPLRPHHAVHVFSECQELASRGLGSQVPFGPTTQNSFRSQSLRELAPLDLCVLKGIFGVVENGAVWHVPANPAVRAAALLAEHLVIVLEAASLVPSLHQAYDQIQLDKAPFGWFLCGPSKTADIEQALVFGAHGPKTMRLILQNSEARS